VISIPAQYSQTARAAANLKKRYAAALFTSLIRIICHEEAKLKLRTGFHCIFAKYQQHDGDFI
jgi:hypothetical protein